MQNDYLMRYISQFSSTLAAILGLARADKHGAALEQIDDTLQTLLGLRLEDLAERSAPEITAAMTLGGVIDLDRDRCLALAALFQTTAQVYAAQGVPDVAYHYNVRALHLLLEGLHGREEARLPDNVPTVETLREPLGAYVLPEETALLLMRHYEALGAYAQAEDVLFALLDHVPDPVLVVEAGLDFYARLHFQSDAALAAGDLPRDEVKAGWEELKQYQR